MKFNILGYEFTGRPKNEPTRSTMDNYFGMLGYSHTRIKQSVPKANAENLRRFSNSVIPRRAINLIKNGVLGLDWEIVSKVDADISNEIDMVKNCLTNPNSTDDFETLFGQVIEDILTGDCGAMEVVKGGNPQRPIWLYPVDGFTVEHYSLWDGSPKGTRYIQKIGTKSIPLSDEELVYFKANYFSYSPLGVSPIEVAFTNIWHFLNAQEYSGSQVSKALPKFILNLGEGIDNATLQAYRKYFDEEIYGSGALPMIGGSKGVNSHQIGAINDDGLYLQYQAFLIAIIAQAFGVPSQKLGVEKSNDRSTIDQLNENVLNDSIKPMAKIIERGINKVLRRFGLSDYVEFKFVFTPTLVQQKQAQENVLMLWEKDLLTADEARHKLNLEKIDKGNMRYTEFVESAKGGDKDRTKTDDAQV